MTSAAMNHTPNWAGAAGNATLSFLGRWTGRGLLFAFRHPLETGMSLLLCAGVGVGSSNALFMQSVRHPAPLFMETASIAQPVDTTTQTATVSATQPIPTPLMRPHDFLVPAPEAQQPVATPKVAVPEKVGNRNVAELQARLTELGFFTGKVDGYYGPQTADAIRRFEAESGLTPVGAVSDEILAAAKAWSRPTATATPEAALPATPTPIATFELATAPVDDPIGRLAASDADTTIEVSIAQPETTAPRKPAAVDPELVRLVQTGLSRLGFLHAEISGKFDSETARAIREFENYNNFRVTGELTPDLVDVLMGEGAFN